jgi:hypothetical protein
MRKRKRSSAHLCCKLISENRKLTVRLGSQGRMVPVVPSASGMLNGLLQRGGPDA